MTADEARSLQIGRGDVMQVNPASGLEQAGQIGIITAVHSWGASLAIGDPANGSRLVAWSNMEYTGGRARWDETGKPVSATVETPLKHHP